MGEDNQDYERALLYVPADIGDITLGRTMS